MVLILAVCGVIGTSQLHLDTAFRPTIIASDSVAESFRTGATDSAQRSNAFIGVIIKDDGTQTPYNHILRQTSLAVDSIDGVTKVYGVSDSAMVDWMYGTPVGKRVRGVVFQPGDGHPYYSIKTLPEHTDTSLRKDALLLISTDPDLTELERSELVVSIVDVLNQSTLPDYALHVAGRDGRSLSTQSVWGAVIHGAAPGLFIILTLLWVGYRNLIVAMIPTISLGLSLPITLGTLNAFHITMPATVSVVPIVILILGTLQAAAIINSFIHWCGKGQTQEGAVRRSIVETGPLCVLASAGIVIAFGLPGIFSGGSMANFSAITVTAGTVVTMVNMVVVPTLLMIIPCEKLIQSRELHRAIQPVQPRVIPSSAEGI